jgi:hypothetical protein
MSKNKIFGLILVALLLAVASVGVFAPAVPSVQAAQLAAPTPQTFNKSKADNAVVTWFDARAITADTRVCVDARNYDVADIQYVIDQGTTNTTTLKLQFSNDKVHFTDGATLVSANAADADNLNRQLLYAKWACVLADVANSNTITITVLGVAK